jgi:hypothetical protein
MECPGAIFTNKKSWKFLFPYPGSATKGLYQRKKQLTTRWDWYKVTGSGMGRAEKRFHCETLHPFFSFEKNAKK